ncbi:hypothetical protein [Paraburkholderia sediminicola]|uniref:hypothetical protein n=1 Tax=Paraburkholderia sediminicola TaxID=458836 RepID=UPI0038BB222F
MNERDFCYWLNGFVELTQGQTPNPAQWKSIQEHLREVFRKVTPPVQTGPLPSTPDPMAGKSLDDIFREYRTTVAPLDWSKMVVTC